MKTYRIGAVLFVCGFLLYLYFTGYIYLDLWAEEELFHARTFPYMIGIAGLVISVLLFILPGNSVPHSITQPISSLKLKPACMLLGITIGYGLVLDYLGFIIASLLFLLSGFVILGERRIFTMTMAAFVLIAGLWFLLDALGIYLGQGQLLSNISRLS